MAEPVPLTIIVVTWNCRVLAEQCLRAALSSRLPGATEIIVVDNGSSDGTPDALAAAFPTVRLIANPTNRGFAAANNQAIAVAGGEYLLLLNPDAFPTAPDTFACILEFLQRRPEYAAAGCRLVFQDGRHQVGDAGYRPTLATVAVHALGISHLAARAHGLFMVRPDRLGDSSTDVDWICGACLMVRASVVREIGPLQTRLFMYAEDIEWGCRMRAAGYRIAYLPALRVIHIQGGTQVGGSPSSAWLDSLGRVYFDLNGPCSFLAFRILLAAGFAARALAYRAREFLPGRRHRAGKSGMMWAYAVRAWRLRPGSVIA